MSSEGKKLLAAIKALPLGETRLMEVCGTHTMAIAKCGIKAMLPENVKLLSGPGCPVCVTPPEVIDAVLELAMRPEVLILDEPTAGLDPRGRNEILDLIASLREATGMTVILVSHSMEDVAKYVERIIVMNGGSVMQDDEPRRVFAHYEELERIGLAAPQVTYIMQELKKRGVPVRTDAITIEEARDEILRALGQQRPHG